ncbi:hypothetical protein HK104_010830 [Borealophlyctis nickersoniae]|nr:hypothetical protein HK104_010830 [Borealophlyctis nickersoniae]
MQHYIFKTDTSADAQTLVPLIQRRANDMVKASETDQTTQRETPRVTHDVDTKLFAIRIPKDIRPSTVMACFQAAFTVNGVDILLTPLTFKDYLFMGQTLPAFRLAGASPTTVQPLTALATNALLSSQNYDNGGAEACLEITRASQKGSQNTRPPAHQGRRHQRETDQEDSWSCRGEETAEERAGVLESEKRTAEETVAVLEDRVQQLQLQLSIANVRLNLQTNNEVDAPASDWSPKIGQTKREHGGTVYQPAKKMRLGEYKDEE